MTYHRAIVLGCAALAVLAVVGAVRVGVRHTVIVYAPVRLEVS